jgi:hypothetical protein
MKMALTELEVSLSGELVKRAQRNLFLQAYIFELRTSAFNTKCSVAALMGNQVNK